MKTKNILSKPVLRSCLVCMVATLCCSKSFSQFIITSGTSVVTSGNVNVVISDLNLNNAGTLNTSSSSFIFSGAGNNTISGNGAYTPFNNLTINKTAGSQLILNGAVNVDGKINFISGDIELNNQVINLNNTGSFVGESETSRATGVNGGQVKANVVLNAPNAVNIGNLGAVITSTANMGNVTVVRKHQSANIVSAAGKSISRSFEITPANNTGLAATLTIQYFDKELNGINENNLSQFQTTDHINYVNAGFSSRNGASNYVTKTGYACLYNYTVSSGGGLQPPFVLYTPDENIFKTKEDAESVRGLKVIPNPVVGEAKVLISTTISGVGMLTLYNTIGQQVWQQAITITSGTNLYPLNMRNVAAGTYSLLFVQHGAANRTIKIIKQ